MAEVTFVAPGTPIHVDHRKWDGITPWQSDSVHLGLDDFGHWPGVLHLLTDARKTHPDAVF